MEAKDNYIQLKVPVENAELVFDALVWRYGMPLTVQDGEDTVPLDKETQARKALIGVVENAVIEHTNMLAIQEAENNRKDLGIS